MLLVLFIPGFASSCKKKVDEPDSINFNPSVTYGSMADQDRNVYKTVLIGNQTWMAENLKTTKYRDGEPIPNVASNKLTETGATHWISSNSEITNESGFTALSAGYRSNQPFLNIEQPCHYRFIGSYGMWWSSTESGSRFARNHWTSQIITGSQFPKHYGFSVRCIMD